MLPGRALAGASVPPACRHLRGAPRRSNAAWQEIRLPEGPGFPFTQVPCGMGGQSLVATPNDSGHNPSPVETPNTDAGRGILGRVLLETQPVKKAHSIHVVFFLEGVLSNVAEPSKDASHLRHARGPSLACEQGLSLLEMEREKEM